MAEGARLESVYTGNRIVGSNPTPSASLSASNILRWVASGAEIPNKHGPSRPNLRTATHSGSRRNGQP